KLEDDLEKAVEFDQSALFKKIYENEYGTLGGTPYSCLIGDYSFGRKAPDIKLLRNIATIAAAAHAPFIGAVAPGMFGIKNFSELPVPRDLAKIFESSELAAWNSFRESEDARYVNLLLPRVLMRLPYGADTQPCEEFGYEETVDGND
ncbi:MAG: type VI secretion system contractile sheath large subunit, partial [Phototrophicales bacterium]